MYINQPGLHNQATTWFCRRHSSDLALIYWSFLEIHLGVLQYTQLKTTTTKQE